MGVRPINNVVDVTNYVLFELNQPLHAFDLDRLRGSAIVVRRARAGEKIAALNEQTYELQPWMGVIADAERPVAIAGVMGGLDTAVTGSTKRIVIESAYFEPPSIRKTGARARALVGFEPPLRARDRRGRGASRGLPRREAHPSRWPEASSAIRADRCRRDDGRPAGDHAPAETRRARSRERGLRAAGAGDPASRSDARSCRGQPGVLR